ncbi:VWA domain-containing protein [Pseudofrankia inefficax]|uniref:von Willebrand factor type A n=1 Tax=Pseudofrankia inefficax (strain DSM 45817 / CECT 9037 / DDB 130130 / EuI1c) TaxID=298654 RepID=E3J5F8_PSEI1|nr:VWA domain-containing protein [Pseudofrankia inefficax]ADP81902.1 von Willebrand factor type A [Pseudofrankia inefficax]
MRLASPWLLVLGLLVVVALAAGARAAARRRQAALAAAGVDAALGRRVPQLGTWLSLAGIAVLALAWAQPAARVPVTRAAGTVIVAVDVSNSMAATDVAPTRLGAAQKAATAFVDAQPSSVNVGVVAFENGALTTDLPSADHAAADAAIARLKVSGGTSLSAAILTSLSAITGKTVALGRDGAVPNIGYWGSATIVLFSDGEDGGAEGASGGGGGGGTGATEAAADTAEAAGVHVETIGVGTTAGATVDVGGYRLHTALDEDTLKAIAQTTGGSYHPASSTASLDGIASTIKLRLTTHREDLPLAGAFIMVAVLLLAAGGLVTVMRTGRLV